jgi:hypothetical protein
MLASRGSSRAAGDAAADAPGTDDPAADDPAADDPATNARGAARIHTTQVGI